MTLSEIAAVVGGEVLGDGDPDLPVTGAAFLDSRQAVPGGLFLAIAGEHVDGHEFVSAALSGGAAAVLCSQPVAGPAVRVADVGESVALLAAHVLVRLRAADRPPTVIAITGSQGKTSVKDMLGAVLAEAGPTVATFGSFNNELGLPLTVLRADSSTRYLVLEMGARGIGHVAQLCAIAPPDISVVLNVGQAHLGEFGSRANIAVAKGELVEALGPEGTAILNADDPAVAAMAVRTQAEVRTFGTAVSAQMRLLQSRVDDYGRASFTLLHQGPQGEERAEVHLRLIGSHQAGNAAAAALAASAAGVELGAAAASLSRITSLSPWRMELRERADGLVVINDAYNANPESTAAALRTLAEIGRKTGRTTVAVLGEMRELGDAGPGEHAAVGRLVEELGIDRLLVVGAGARAISDVHQSAQFYASVEDLVAALRKNVDGTEVVLVKASRAARLERAAAALLGGDHDGKGASR